MKYLAFLVLILFACTGATIEQQPEKSVHTIYYESTHLYRDTFYELEYEGCRYLLINDKSSHSGGPTMVHKGNCPNHSK